MMADHWKSLANLLGAPGVDEPEADEVVAEEVAEVLPPEIPATPKQAEPQPIARAISIDRDEFLSFSRALPDEEVEARPQPSKAAKEIRPPAPRPIPAEPMVETPAMELDPKKQKKRSSWEKLAGMFNISIDRPEEPPAPPAEPEPAPAKVIHPTRSPSTKPELSLFADDDVKPANPALDAMFADAPREKLGGWGSSRRKMVDDIGWGESESSASPIQEKAKPETASEPMARETPADESDPDAPRRGRRRRGRRGRGDEAVRSGREEAKSPSEDRWGGNEIRSVSSNEAWDEPESFEIVGDFEAARDEFADELPVDLELADEDLQPEEEGEAVRRSSRRRRRGRVRSPEESTEGDKPRLKNDATEASPRAEARPRPRPQEDRPARSTDDRPVRSQEDRPVRSHDERPRSNENRARPAEGRNRDPERTRQPEERRPRPADERRPRVSEERRPPAAEDEDSPRVPELDRESANGRRRRRKRPSDTRAEAVDRDIDPVELNDDMVHDADEPADADKHRNIPTWIDSLQSIIESNIENHRRNDSRGGGSRGRPRGGGGRR